MLCPGKEILYQLPMVGYDPFLILNEQLLLGHSEILLMNKRIILMYTGEMMEASSTESRFKGKAANCMWCANDTALEEDNSHRAVHQFTSQMSVINIASQLRGAYSEHSNSLDLYSNQ